MRVIDLSQEISPDMQVFPSYPKPTFVPWTRLGIHPFESEAIFLVTHTGTHVDAPCHFVKKAKEMHQIQPDALLHEGVLLDLTHKKPKEYIRSEDLKEAEKKSGAAVKENDVVLIRTAWDRNLGKPEYLTNYPGVSKDGADFLVSKKIAAAGVDSPNIDHPDDSSFPAHTTLLLNEILVLENLYNVRGIQKSRFRFVALPLRLQGATGSPIRAVAIED